MSEGHVPSAWEVLSEKQVAACRVFNVFEEHCRHPLDGREGTFYSITSNDWVNTLALTPKLELVMVRQYRFAIRELSWEIPGGIVDPGEEPLAAGLRELREETGFCGENARLLAHCSPNPAIIRNRCHFAYVENVQQTESLDLDSNEEIEIQTIPVHEAFAWAQDFKIRHTLTLNALFYLQNLVGLPPQDQTG